MTSSGVVAHLRFAWNLSKKREVIPSDFKTPARLTGRLRQAGNPEQSHVWMPAYPASNQRDAKSAKSAGMTRYF
jgi:hypothetical protein